MSLRPAGHLHETCLKACVLLVSSCGHRMLREGSYPAMLKTRATEEKSTPGFCSRLWTEEVNPEPQCLHSACTVRPLFTG